MRPVDLSVHDPLETAGIGLDHAGVHGGVHGGVQGGIHGKALAADQSRRHAAADNLLEDLAQDIALAEAAVAVHREGRCGTLSSRPRPQNQR